MMSVFIIAKNTFLEIIRSRILYGLLIFSLFIIMFSQVLGKLSFSEQERISASFGLTGIHLSACILAIFIGGGLLYKEIEKKTIFTLLVRPLTRFEFLIGKILGLLFLICFLEFCVGSVLALAFFWFDFNIDLSFLIALYGIFLEALVLSSVALFFSSFATPYVVVSSSIGMFLIGHWMDSFAFFSEKSSSEAFKIVHDVVQWVIPNLEKFNWRSLVIYKDTISFDVIATHSLYGFMYFCIFICLAGIIVEKKDFN